MRSITTLIEEHRLACAERVANLGLRCTCDPNRIDPNDHSTDCRVGALRDVIWRGMLQQWLDEQATGPGDAARGAERSAHSWGAPVVGCDCQLCRDRRGVTAMTAADIGLEGPVWIVPRHLARHR